MAIYENATSLKTFWGPVAFILYLLLPLATKARRSRWVSLWKEGRVFIVIAAIPIVWLEVMSNHSQIHAAFTHLNFAPAFVVAGLVLFNRSKILNVY